MKQCEVEQIAKQENECDQAGCSNEMNLNTNSRNNINNEYRYSHGSEYSAEIDRSEQKNKDCSDSLHVKILQTRTSGIQYSRRRRI